MSYETCRDYEYPSDWFEPDCDEMDTSEWVHVDDMPDLDHMADELKKLIEIVYGHRDLEDIDEVIDELASQLNVRWDLATKQIRKV